MPGVLAGLKVLDLSWGISGPMTTMLLVDHGAEVTKIEPPGGDPYRGQLGYKVWGRGKRNAILDLKDKEDLASFKALASAADILVESYAPGVTTRLGIDYETLSALNPRLIYVSITGYGRGTKDADRPAYDALVAARTGIQWEQRGFPEGAVYRMSRLPDPFPDLEVPYDWVQGPPRPGPIFSASHWPSLGAFFAASTGLNAALRAREVTGRGQWVETSLQQGAMAGASGVWQRSESPDAEGFNSYILGSKSPKGHYECKDGRWLHNWVPNPRFIMTASAGDTLNSSPDLTVQNDPDRFGLAPEEIFVMMHYQPILMEAMKKFTCDEWVEAAAVAEMTMQEARSPETALADPLLLEDGCVTPIDDPELGRIHQVGITYKMTTSPGVIPGPAVASGTHTAAVKAEAAAAKPQVAKPGRTLKAPLDGITVVDLGLAIAGPYGTQLLADLGADVIKINAPYDTYWHRCHIAYMANRGKRSIALNLKQPKAMEILREIVAKADVVQHNMRYDAAERLGIDYESLKKINPKLIYCHTRGHETGPRQKLPGNDQTGGCLAGVQYADGGMARGGKPLWSFTSFGDTGCGFLSAIGIMQALYHRDRTGEGQFVDTSIVNAQLLNTSYVVGRPDGTGFERPQLDRLQLGLSALHRLYETSAGWLCLIVPTEEHWDRLCLAMGLEGLETDPRFATADARTANDDLLATTLAAAFAGKSAAAWFAVLDAAGVPCEISNPDFALGIFDDAELAKRHWTASYHHPAIGKLDQIGLLFELSDTPGVLQGPPLVVGQYSREILAGLGYGEAEIDAFCQEKIVTAWQPGQANAAVASPWQASSEKK